MHTHAAAIDEDRARCLGECLGGFDEGAICWSAQ